jgi:hypothetical protein
MRCRPSKGRCETGLVVPRFDNLQLFFERGDCGGGLGVDSYPTWARSDQQFAWTDSVTQWGLPQRSSVNKCAVEPPRHIIPDAVHNSG